MSFPKKITLFFFIYCAVPLSAQDTNYVRRCLKFLCSPTCFGRGYTKGGLQQAERFIIAELKKAEALPLFTGKWTQNFTHAVNTFPKHCEVKCEGKTLTPGVDYILNPASCGGKGKCALTPRDSLTLVGNTASMSVVVKLQKKLTFGVASVCNANTIFIELDKKRTPTLPTTLEWNITQKHIPNFESRNIGAFISGTQAPDSMVVFTAHYDHLGGMGRSTFFAGANDNGAGIAGLLDLVRYYKIHPPKYTTVFIFFAGEEAGLVGSAFFVNNSPIDLKKIKFLINLDLIGTGDDGIAVVNATEFKTAFEQLKTINTEQPFVKFIKPRGKAANSDHYWFTEKGVPAFFIYTMGGISAYHDVYDVEKTLPLSDYVDLMALLIKFITSIK